MPFVSSLARRVGGHRWFTTVGRSYVPLDRFFGKLTKGRFVALGMTDVPALLLTTTGRRTGRPRTSPLLYAVHDDAFVVAGSNWGQRQHPAWSGNLLADPAATITLHGERIAVRARLVEDGDRDRLWTLLEAIWPAYATYRNRAANRKIRVFRLEPTDLARRPRPTG